MKKINEPSAIVDRLKEFTHARSDRHLAEILGVSHTTPHVWRKNGVPNIAAILAQLPDVNVDWLLYGEGERSKQAANIEDVPSTRDDAMTEYEKLREAFGLRERWEDLEDEQRHRLRLMFSMMVSEIERVRSDYAVKMVRIIARE